MAHVLWMLVAVTALGPAEGQFPVGLDLEPVRGLAVQHDGRWMPFDTLARDLVESVTGETHYDGRDPVALLLAWTFNPEYWAGQPLIRVKNADLRHELELPADRTAFSYYELRSHARLRALLGQVAQAEGGRKLDPLEAKASDIGAQLGQFDLVFGNQAIRCVPDPQERDAPWNVLALSAGRAATPDAPTDAWAAVQEAFLAGDGPAFSSAARHLADALAALPAAYRPSREQISTELRYNRMQPFHLAAMVMLVGAVLSALAMVVRRKWFDLLAVLGLLGGFGMLSYGLWMRWQIAGRIPASNMFESLLFLSWGMGAFAIVAMLAVRHRVVPLTASALGAVALLLADVLPVDSFIRPIPPVLADTIWMSIHVPIIMVSYSVLALAVLIAHAQLAVMAVAPGRSVRGGLAARIDTLHYWYVLVGSLLLLAGILTGSMWAASSWGRYWGWDPKEVWSLVAFLGYMAILHVRVDHDRVPRWAYVAAAVVALAVFVTLGIKLNAPPAATIAALAAAAAAMIYFVAARGPFATAVKSILAFWLIVMTYVGVNYVLGTGLHSYGFGTGAVAWRMLYVGLADLALVAACGALYLLRRPQASTAGPIRLPLAVVR